MRVSTQGIFCLAADEGIVLGAYRDSVGVLTYGIGHTAKAGPPDPAHITLEHPDEVILRDAINVFRRDLAKFEQRVSDATENTAMKQHEFDALVSFDFNTGQIYKASGTKAFISGNKADASRRYKLYNKGRNPKTGNLEVINGLKVRRDREMAIFMDGNYHTERTIPVYRVKDQKLQGIAYGIDYARFCQLIGTHDDAKKPTLEQEIEIAAGQIQEAVINDAKREAEAGSGVQPQHQTLRQRSRGERVVDVQCRLHELGYGLREEDIDGIYGHQTASAVASWQLAVGRTSTGELTSEGYDMLMSTSIRKPVPRTRTKEACKVAIKHEPTIKSAKKAIGTGSAVAGAGAMMGLSEISTVTDWLGSTGGMAVIDAIKANYWLLIALVGMALIYLGREQISDFFKRFEDGD